MRDRLLFWIAYLLVLLAGLGLTGTTWSEF